jgi:hypothetical protein
MKNQCRKKYTILNLQHHNNRETRFWWSLAISLLVIFQLMGGVSTANAATPVSFTGEELLGKPTNSSVTVSIIPDSEIEYHYQFGTTPGSYSGQTPTVTAAGGSPHETTITGLSANTKYFYRMRYHRPGEGDWIERPEHSFWTQRAAGQAFTFSITSDSHVDIMLGNAQTWTSTLDNVADDNPDFLIDLGDTFAMDNVNSAAGAENAYRFQRQFFDAIGHSSSIYVMPGNHEQTEGWHADDFGPNPADNLPAFSINALKKFYVNPVPDGFYTGNPETFSYISEDHLLEDYFAWTWGDALFVVIDPYWYTETKPYGGNTGGGETSDTGSGDRWDWTLGYDQYLWLTDVLENSNTAYKFIFAHHMVGGSDDYVRGGAVPAHLVEWGGYDDDTGQWAFDTERPGWEKPIHQLFIDTDVSAFFHGHDHQYAYEVRDDIVYLSMPAAGFSGSGFNIYNEANEYTERAMPSPGHLQVNVSPAVTEFNYIDTTSGSINHTFTIDPNELPTGLLGDVNADTLVDSADALIVLSADADMDEEVASFCPMNCGDVNGDGFVNSTDASIILSYNGGLSVPYSVGEVGCPESITLPPGCTALP